MVLQSAKSTANELADKDVDSTDTELRYAAYGARLRTALRAGHRYLAYVRTASSRNRTRVDIPLALSDQRRRRSFSTGRTSFHSDGSVRDFLAVPSGVSSRIHPPFAIRPTFPFRDVGYESYKAHRRGPTPFEAAHFTEPTRMGLVAVKRATFQSVASM